MAATFAFVFDSSPFVASCQFVVGRRVVAKIALPGVDVQIPPAVYAELVTRVGARPDALKAADLITAGHIRVADTTAVSEVLEDLQHYQLGQGETEALTLTAGLSAVAVMVRDDFLALIVANRLGLTCQLFLDFIVGRAEHGELTVTDAHKWSRRSAPAIPPDSSRTHWRC